MRNSSRAFTLVELLVVMAILGLLSAILFPVFSAAKGGAERASCMGNLRNLGTGSHLYLEDYDDFLMPVNQAPAQPPNSRNDRTWVQILLPYVRSFSVFRCPADHTSRPSLSSSFDQDLVPGDTDSQYYTASLRSNYGYNFQNLAPIVFQGGKWVALTKSLSEVRDPSSTLVFADSVWAETSSSEPTGGGNWLITPPCRYYAGDSRIDSFTGQPVGQSAVFTTTRGWHGLETLQYGGEPYGHEDGFGPNDYGNVWPWHFGHVNMAMLDGSVHSLSPAQLTAGCDVKDAWKGLIIDPLTYLWDVK